MESESWRDRGVGGGGRGEKSWTHDSVAIDFRMPKIRADWRTIGGLPTWHDAGEMTEGESKFRAGLGLHRGRTERVQPKKVGLGWKNTGAEKADGIVVALAPGGDGAGDW